MSLLGQSIYTAKKSTSTGLTKLNLILSTAPDGDAPPIIVVEGYTGAFVSFLDGNTIFVDLPTTFNNLYQVTTNIQAHPGSATLLFALGNIFAAPSTLSMNLGHVVWFPGFTGSPPPLNPQFTRIWFACVNSAGSTFLPTGFIAIELGITNTSVVGVAPGS